MLENLASGHGPGKLDGELWEPDKWMAHTGNWRGAGLDRTYTTLTGKMQEVVGEMAGCRALRERKREEEEEGKEWASHLLCAPA